MPDSHTARSVYVGVKPQSTVRAVEIRLSGTRTDMQTTRTTFRSVGGIDRHALNTGGSRLVFDKTAELSERPTMEVFGHKPLGTSADARQIFQDDALPVSFGVRDEALADAVVDVRDKSILPSRDTPQHTLGGAAGVGLETRPGSLKRSFLVVNKLRRVKSIVRRDSNTLYAQINPQTALWFVWFGRVPVDRDVQVKFAISENQVYATNLPCSQLLAHRSGHLHFTGHPTLWANRQRHFMKVAFESQGARIIAHRRKLFEFVLLIRFAGALFGNFRNRVDGVLRRQVSLLTHLIVRRVMQVITAMQSLSEADVSHQITAARKLAHRRLQFVGDMRSDDQLCFDYLLKSFHAARISQTEFYASLTRRLNNGVSRTGFLCHLKVTVSA